MNSYRPKSRIIPKRSDDQPYLFEGMHDRYGFDMRVAVGEFYERLARAIYGGHSPNKLHTHYGINVDPDLTNGSWWREVKAQWTSERLYMRHLQLWRYLMLMYKQPGKRFHYVVCRYRTERPLKEYKQHMDELEAALAAGLKLVIQLPFSVVFRVCMLPDDRAIIYRERSSPIAEGDNRFYMTSWWQCRRVRELAEHGISAIGTWGLDHSQYVEHRFKCRLEGTNSFEILNVKERFPVQAQRDLLQEYDDDIGYFIDLENGIYAENTELETDVSFVDDIQEELKLENTYDVPF